MLMTTSNLSTEPRLPADRVERLRRLGPNHDASLLRSLLEDPDAVTPGLLDLLASAPRKDAGLDSEDPRWWAAVHAGLVLLALRERRALPVFEVLFEDEERHYLLNWFGLHLATYGPDITALLVGLLEDGELTPYGRTLCVDLLAQLGRTYPDMSRFVGDQLAGQLPTDLDQWETGEGQDLFWSWILLNLAELGADGLEGIAQQLAEAGRLDTRITGPLADLERRASSPLLTETLPPFDLFSVHEALFAEAGAGTPLEGNERVPFGTYVAPPVVGGEDIVTLRDPSSGTKETLPYRTARSRIESGWIVERVAAHHLTN